MEQRDLRKINAAYPFKVMSAFHVGQTLAAQFGAS
jgi:hypothetical protein